VKSIRLLLADPDQVFRSLLASLLRAHGYLVTEAANPMDAVACLSDHWFHLVIMNIHLSDAADPEDTSGMELLKAEPFLPVPKLVLADFPTVSLTREVLKPGPARTPLAIDFLGKDASLDVIVISIEDALQRHIRANWEIKIRLRDSLSFIQLARLLSPDLVPEQLTERADELEYLARSQFACAQQVTIGRLLYWREGYVVFDLNAHTGEVQNFLVTYSQAGESGDRTTPDALDGLVWKSQQATAHYRMQVYHINYHFSLHTLGEVMSAGGVECTRTVLESLIKQTLPRWHANQASFSLPEQVEEMIKVHADLHPDSLDDRIEALCREGRQYGLAQVDYSRQQLKFTFEQGQSSIYPNPCFVMAHRRLATAGSMVASGLIHGRLTGGTVLLDASGESWLIGRDRVRVAPLLLDYAALELIIRIEGMKGVSLLRRAEIERHLAENSQSEEGLSAVEAGVLQSIRSIRRAAKCDPVAYHLGLFYGCLAQIESRYQPQWEFDRSEMVILLHLLLLSSMICTCLVHEEIIPQQALDNRLWIDLSTHEVWVEGHKVDLTPQDLDILIYLYEHAGVRQSREQILQAVFGIKKENVDLEENRLNSAISRLRLKIEPDPDHPKYLQTIRGYGYCLEL
jgi:DNA-binding response OmpR family regulator